MSNANELQSVIDRRRQENKREQAGARLRSIEEIVREQDRPPAAREVYNAEIIGIWERAERLRDCEDPKERERLMRQLAERDVFDLIIMVGRERTKNRAIEADIERLRAVVPQR